MSDGPAGEARDDAVAAIALLFAKRRTAGAVSMSGSHNPTPAEVKVAEEAFDIATRAARAGAAKGGCDVEPEPGDRRVCVYVKCESCGGCFWTDIEDDKCGCGLLVCQSCVDVFNHAGKGAHGTGYPHDEARRLRALAPPAASSCVVCNAATALKSLAPPHDCVAPAASTPNEGDALSLEAFGLTEEQVIAYAESRTERREARLAKEARAAQPTPPAPSDLRWILRDAREYLMTGDTNTNRKLGLITRIECALDAIAPPDGARDARDDIDDNDEPGAKCPACIDCGYDPVCKHPQHTRRAPDGAKHARGEGESSSCTARNPDRNVGADPETRGPSVIAGGPGEPGLRDDSIPRAGASDARERDVAFLLDAYIDAVAQGTHYEERDGRKMYGHSCLSTYEEAWDFLGLTERDVTEETFRAAVEAKRAALAARARADARGEA